MGNTHETQINLATGKYKLKQHCGECLPYFPPLIKGNNLIFTEHLFCARHRAKSFLNINSAFQLNKPWEVGTNSISILPIKNCTQKSQELAWNSLSWEGQSGVWAQVCMVPSPFSPHTGFSRVSVQATCNAWIWCFGKSPESCETQAAKEDWKETNKNLRKSSHLGSRREEAVCFGRV